nr:DUF1043 family protein [Marinibactrum halimedae]
MISLAIGAVVGGLCVKAFGSQEQHSRELEDRLAKAESQLKDYQTEVTQHFLETTKLVNTLTQNYRDLHDHFAQSSLKLANTDISREFLEGAAKGIQTKGSEQASTLADPGVMPPKDWSPNKGTLSESFGLKEEEDDLLMATVHGRQTQ